MYFHFLPQLTLPLTTAVPFFSASFFRAPADLTPLDSSFLPLEGNGCTGRFGRALSKAACTTDFEPG